MLFFRKLIKLPSQLIEMRYHHANLHLMKPDFARIQPSLFRIHSAFVRYTVFYLQVPNDKDFPIPDEETQATDNEPTTRIMEKEQVPNDKDFPIPDEETQATDNELYTSSDPNFWDYVRQKDITKNSGIEPNDFHSFIVKELLDNAADFQERNHIDGIIIVHTTRNNDLFQISVKNSNPDNIPVFTNLIETFNFKRAYSEQK